MNSKLGLPRKLKTHYGYLRGRILRLDNTRNLNSKGSRRNKFAFWRERRVGRCEAPRRRRCRTSSRSGNNADARPPPRPFGLRPAGQLAFLLAPYIPPPVSLVSRPPPARLGARSKMISYFSVR